MDMRYIAVICFGVVALCLCLFASFFTKKEKVKTIIFIKGLANFSFIVLALVCCNIVYFTEAYSLFIICALAGFMFSSILKNLPTKTDMFRIFYTIVDSISLAFIAIALLFVSNFSLIGLLVGVGIFLITILIYLTIKKSHEKKEKLSNLLLLFIASLTVGFATNILLNSFLASLLPIIIGSLLLFVNAIIHPFTTMENKKSMIIKNLFLDVGLILLAISICLI